MIRDQLRFEKYLLKKGANIKDLTFTWFEHEDESYRVSIYRKDGIKSIFIFMDEYVAISMDKKTENLNDKTMLNIINVDSRMKAFYEDDKIVVCMVSPTNPESIYNMYREGLLIMECF